jgi:hypothetical protein
MGNRAAELYPLYPDIFSSHFLVLIEFSTTQDTMLLFHSPSSDLMLKTAYIRKLLIRTPVSSPYSLQCVTDFGTKICFTERESGCVVYVCTTFRNSA